MTTYAYELIDPPIADIASSILNYGHADIYTPDIIEAVLQFAQHEQNTDLYAICYARLHRGAIEELPDDPWKSDDPNLDCKTHGFVYKIGLVGCQICLALDERDENDLTAGTTFVRLLLLSCGHVDWHEHRIDTTVNECSACGLTVTVKHYIDEQAIDA